jgi:integrase/recombinase XerD
MKTRVCLMLWQRTERVNRKGEAPIVCRITVRGNSCEIGTYHRAALTDWNNERKQIKGNRVANDYFRKMLDQLTDIHADLERQGKPVTAQAIARVYRNNGAVWGLRELLDAFLVERKELIGLEICARTVVHQQTKFNRIQDFLRLHGLTQMRPEEFTHTVADKLLLWLMRDLKYTRNSANKVGQFIYQAFRWAVRREHLEKSPLELYQFKLEASKEIVYLEADEVEKLACFEFVDARLARARDCFIFQCFTGLAYADLKALNVAQCVETAPNGRRFLRVRRAKSTLFKGLECVIPLLPEAERLLAHYNDALPVYTGQYYNRALKEIGQLVGLRPEQMTTHIGRKTAGTLMLNKGIPTEAVSKFLGHSNVRVTQKLYAKLLDTTVLDAFAVAFGSPTPSPESPAAPETGGVVRKLWAA